MARDECRERKFKLLCLDGSDVVNIIFAHATCVKCRRRGLYHSMNYKVVIRDARDAYHTFYTVGELLQSDISDCSCINADDCGRTVCAECVVGMEEHYE